MACWSLTSGHPCRRSLGLKPSPGTARCAQERGRAQRPAGQGRPRSPRVTEAFLPRSLPGTILRSSHSFMSAIREVPAPKAIPGHREPPPPDPESGHLTPLPTLLATFCGRLRHGTGCTALQWSVFPATCPSGPWVLQDECRDIWRPRIFLTTRVSEKNVQSGVPSTSNYIPWMLSLKGSRLGSELQFFLLKIEINITFLSCVTQGAQLWDDL